MPRGRKRKETVDSVDDCLQMLEEEMLSEFGPGTAGKLSSSDSLSQIKDWVSTRSMVVDKVLAGGRNEPCSLVPFGRQMELSGPPGSGKTTLCAQIAASTQEKGGIVVVTDTEERIAHDYWRSLGVDTGSIINIKAQTLEEVFERQHFCIRTMMERAPDKLVLMIWDSIGGTSSGIIDEDAKGSIMEQAAKIMGREAKTIGNGVKVLNPLIAKSKTCYLYTNHIYSKLNVTYGDATETYGGNKLKFMATIRLGLKPVGKIKESTPTGDAIIGNRVEVKAHKNSMAPQQLIKEAVLIGGEGFSDDYSVFELGKKVGVIQKNGAWSTAVFPSGDEVKFQGWNGFKEKVSTHPEYELIKQRVRELI